MYSWPNQDFSEMESTLSVQQVSEFHTVWMCYNYISDTGTCAYPCLIKQYVLFRYTYNINFVKRYWFMQLTLPHIYLG